MTEQQLVPISSHYQPHYSLILVSNIKLLGFQQADTNSNLFKYHKRISVVSYVTSKIVKLNELIKGLEFTLPESQKR